MPDFRAETMYFVLLDRFHDGTPENNTGKKNDLYDPTRTDFFKYWGGDIAGLISKLDYLKGMGISAIWITPVFDQIDFAITSTGRKIAPYHGYWARDFKRIDEHLVEDPADVRVFSSSRTIFDKLVREMHKRGMKLILDIVCNHSNPQSEGGRGELFDDGRPIASYQNDDGKWYHHFGEVTNWNNLDEVQDKTFCDLADFNEESVSFRNYIKGSIKLWLGKGVDGLRVDTVKHMPIWFWQEFMSDILESRPDIFVFGEWFLGGAYDPASIEFANKSGMSMLDFSLRQAIVDILGTGSYAGFPQVVEVLNRDGEFMSATELVTFIDNHDLPRFINFTKDRARLRMALDLIMLSRGIPCIYYGTEQYLCNDTNGGADPYNRPMMESWDTGTELYREIGILADLRKRNAAVQKGSQVTKYLTGDIYVFMRKYMDNFCLAAFNKGDRAEIRVDHLEMPDGEYEDVLGGGTFSVRNAGVTLPLEHNAIIVLEKSKDPPRGKSTVMFQVHNFSTRYGQDIFITGSCPELGSWDMAKAVRMEYINAKTWAVEVPFDASSGKDVRYKFVAVQDHELVRENGLPHQRRIPEKGFEDWHDGWLF
jgi:cyclomaltodextrin glucanotransferase